jgi:threonyl-tRNA synthetase
VDDRQESVSRKVRDAEVEWVPYTVVVGQRETLEGKLQVRCRGEADPRALTAAELTGHLHERTGDMPWLPLPIPRQLSRRPRFFG